MPGQFSLPHAVCGGGPGRGAPPPAKEPPSFAPKFEFPHSRTPAFPHSRTHALTHSRTHALTHYTAAATRTCHRNSAPAAQQYHEKA